MISVFWPEGFFIVIIAHNRTCRSICPSTRPYPLTIAISVLLSSISTRLVIQSLVYKNSRINQKIFPPVKNFGMVHGDAHEYIKIGRI